MQAVWGVQSTRACLGDNRALPSQRTTGDRFEFPLGKASSICSLPLTGHPVRHRPQLECGGLAGPSLYGHSQALSLLFFQTVNIPSMNAVYQKTFLGVSKRTQEPKGVARLVTTTALFSCMLCPRHHVHHQIPGQEGALGALSSPFCAFRTTLKPSRSSINPFSISLVPGTVLGLHKS